MVRALHVVGWWWQALERLVRLGPQGACRRARCVVKPGTVGLLTVALARARVVGVGMGHTCPTKEEMTSPLRNPHKSGQGMLLLAALVVAVAVPAEAEEGKTKETYRETVVVVAGGLEAGYLEGFLERVGAWSGGWLAPASTAGRSDRLGQALAQKAPVSAARGHVGERGNCYIDLAATCSRPSAFGTQRTSQ